MKTKIKLMALVAGLMSVLPMTSAWAYSTTFYAKLTAKVATDSTGLGKVYVQSETPSASSTGTASGTVSTQNAKSGSVTVSAGVSYDKDAVSFLGWSTTGNKDDISTTSESYSVTQTSTSTSESSPTDFGTVYAHFKTITLDPFSITFGQSGSGTYTVNGNPVENLSGLTAATVVKLASSDPNFFCWKVNGKTFVDNPYTVTCKEDTTVSVEFLTDANVAEIADADELVELLTYDEIKKIIIPAGKNVYIERGTAVTIPDSKMLTVDGNLFVEGSLSGTIVGNGKVSKCTTFIQQTGVDGQCGPEAIPFASWPDLGVVYWTTTTDSYKATVTGTCNTPDGVLEHVKLVNGKGGVVRSAQEKRTSTVFYAGVDKTVAMNHITSIGAQAVINTIHASGHAETFKLLTGATTYNGEGTNGGNKYAHGWGVTECAGNALTIKCELGGGSAFKLINGAVTISGSVQATDTYFINCTKAQAKTYHSDTTKNQSFRFFETTGIDIKTTMATGGEGAKFYSGKYDVTLKGTNWKVVGGAYKNDPNDNLADKVNYEAKQRPEDNYWVVVPKAPPECVATVGDAQYMTLEEAIANTMSGTIKLQGHVSLLNPVEIASGQSLTIELEGYKITGGSGVFVNRGTLVLNDGSNNDAPSYVMAESGYLFDNYGTLEITCGYYSGKVRLNAGNFITHGGTFNVAMEAGEGVTDKAAVAEIRGGVFKTDSNVAAEAEIVDAATQYVGGFLDEGFVAVPYDGALWIGSDQYAICQEISLSGAEKAWRLTAIDPADQDLYIRNPPTRADCKDDAEWKRFQEVTTWIKPYSTKVIDCVLEFDHDIAPGSLTAVVSFLPQTLDEAIPANTLYSALIPRITAYQIAYSRFINDSDWNLLDCGIKNNSLDNIGTTCNIYMYLCNQNRDKLVDLKWTYTYSNFRPIAKCTYKFTGKGAICGDTDYDSLVAALAAVSDGGTVKLSKDCEETIVVDRAMTFTLDKNSFAFNGSITAATGYGLADDGKGTYTVTREALPVAKVGETQYMDVEQAVTAAKAQKATVALLADTTADKVRLTPDWSLNLNGFQVTGAIEIDADYTFDYGLKRSGEIYSAVPYVAQIGDGAKYIALQGAVNAAQGLSPRPVVVTLLTDCDEKVILPVWVALDTNGKTADNVCAPNGFALVPDANGNLVIEQARVARLGDALYDSLTAAIDAAGSWGAVIKLLKSTGEEIVVDKELTIELNGFACDGVGADAEKRYRKDVVDGQVVIAHPDVARVGERYFEDLQGAVDEAMLAVGSKIVLLKDCDDDVVVEAAGSFTIDFTDFDFYGDVFVIDDTLSLGQRFSFADDRALATWTVADAKKVQVASTEASADVVSVKVSSELAAAIGGDDEAVSKAVQEAVAEADKSGSVFQGLAEVVKTKTDTVTETAIKAELSSNVELEPVSLSDLGTGVYQPTKVVEVAVEGAGGMVTESVSVPDTNQDALTVIKNEAPDERLMLAVPGEKTVNGVDFTVANIIATTPTEGDEIQVYVHEGAVSGYRTWRWNGADWITVTPVAATPVSPCDAGAQVLASGQAFWYKRNNHRKPVTIVAKYVDEITTTIKDQGVVDQDKDTVEPAWNMVANPVAAEMDLNDIKMEDAQGTSHAEDSIVIPNDTGAGEKIYTQKDGKWGYVETVESGEVTIKGKKVKILSSKWNDSDTKVKAGKGFWYLSNGGKPTIKWGQPVNGNK